MSQGTGFFQDPPQLKNSFSNHRWLAAYLRWCLPKEVWSAQREGLTQFGERCATDWAALGRQAETEKPVHIPYSPWGRRIDEIKLSSAWSTLEKISAEEGLVAEAYERKNAEHSRVLQFAKLMMFHPSSAFFTCPLAMCDGAAKVFETYGSTDSHKEAFRKLTSRDPKVFWTSGQWMTERTGGSDVSRSETVAKPSSKGYTLHGVKWFSSSTVSQMALALGRIDGGDKLTLFYLQLRRADGSLNGIEVLRLKDKLGTWGLPTAELRLEGTVAETVGEIGRGVKTVASMLNITRLYNSICSVGQASRGLDLIRDYSNRREVFGQKLKDHVLHYQAFAREEVKTLAGFLITMELVKNLGREETGQASSEDIIMLRLLTPVAKLFTAKACIRTASEVIEGFGGAGYVEDTGIPVLLRDAQVFPIWEGATNVLCHDILRVAEKSDALRILAESIQKDLQVVSSVSPRLQEAVAAYLRSFQGLMNQPPESLVAGTRSLAFQTAWVKSSLALARWIKEDMNAKPLSSWLDVMLDQLEECLQSGKSDVKKMHSVWQTQLEC